VRPSVVIASYNEEPVIGRCLDALLAGGGPGGLDITVVANGCTDRTAAVAAARRGVRVLDRPQPGKAAAMNAGDAVALGFPRFYLDADIVVPPGGIAGLCAALSGDDGGGPAPLAVVPSRRLDLTGRPLPVRAFYAINSRLPVYDGALFGRGLIGLSQTGRGRFGEFPDVIADDLFLDSQFAADEKREVASVAVTVGTPRRTTDLVRRLVRVRAGNAALRAGESAGRDGPAAVRAAVRSSWLRDVVVPRPWLAPAAVCYAGLTVTAAVLARRGGGSVDWGHDESARSSTRPAKVR
jgi:glycosyltransferase involved in cell wall biosynthesis